MGNLTTNQLSAIRAGAPIKQKWSVMLPLGATHPAYAEYTLDEQVIPADGTENHLVVKAGKRKHVVWNPHPTVTPKATALRYTFECKNPDGYFFVGADSIWNSFGIYPECTPQECSVVHRIYIRELSGTWTEVTHMTYTGAIVDVHFNLSGADTGGTVTDRAVIVTEQQGAWNTLRRVFTHEDADDDEVLELGGTQWWFTAI